MNAEELLKVLEEVYRAHQKENSFGVSDELKQKLVSAGILENTRDTLCGDPYYDSDVLAFGYRVLKALTKKEGQ